MTGVDAIRNGPGATRDVVLRTARVPEVLCRFDERSGLATFPGAPSPAPAPAPANARASAADACSAVARERGIRLGALESVQAVSDGEFDVRYARPPMGKPQLCHYSARRRLATFASDAAVPTPLPSPRAPQHAPEPKMAQEAGEGCLAIARSRGQIEANVVSVRPMGGVFYEVEIRLGPAPTDPIQRCRYNAQERTAAPM